MGLPISLGPRSPDTSGRPSHSSSSVSMRTTAVSGRWRNAGIDRTFLFDAYLVHEDSCAAPLNEPPIADHLPLESPGHASASKGTRGLVPKSPGRAFS